MAKTTINESEYLQQEAAKAKAEISQALAKAKEALGQQIDPREVTRRHPWIAIGAAAVAGFAAVAVAVPSKHERELRRLERLREAMSPPPPKPAETNGHAARPVEKPSWIAVLLKEVMQLIRPILLTTITASIKAAASPPASGVEPEADVEGPDKSPEPA